MTRIEQAIEHATCLGQRLEDLIVNRGHFNIRSERDDIYIGYWSLICEYSKGILCLLRFNFPSPAFALQRPLVDALVKAHIALIGTPEDVEKIRKDWYNVRLDKDGARIDAALGTGTLLHDYLTIAKKYLHSLTHSGKAQLWRRFDGDDVGASFTEDEILGVIGLTASAVFLITILIARHFDYEQERLSAERIHQEYGDLTYATRKGD
jgi:hypothetical protein